MKTKQLYEIRQGKPVKVYPVISPTSICGCKMAGSILSSTDARLLKIAGTTLEILFRTGDDVSTMQYLFSIRPGGASSYGIAIKNETLQFWYGNMNKVVGVTAGCLYHVVMVNTAETSTFYLNGKEYTIAANIFSDPLNFILGGLGSSYFNGTIYHCRVFNYPVLPSLAAKLFSNGRPLQTPLEDENLIAEFLPGGLSPARWSASNEGPHLDATGEIGSEYEAPVYERVIPANNAPALPPQFVGQLYVDESAQSVFVATGTGSILDWKPI